MSRCLPICVMAVLSCFGSVAFAGTNILSVGSTVVDAGQEAAEVQISMSNEDRIAGIEFWIPLPESMALSSEPAILGAHTYGADDIGTALLTAKGIDNDGDGIEELVKVLIFNIGQDANTGKIATIPEGSGVIVNVYFDIADGTNGQVHQLQLTNVVLGDDDGKSLPVSTVSGTLTIGDADLDGDGYSGEDFGGDDCDDDDPDVHPDAEEIPYDGIDQDCDDADLTDVDGDGYDSDKVDGGDDCDDEDVDVHPGAVEVAYDGKDNDCADGDLSDVDGDGYDSDQVIGGDDCDDEDAGVHPGATDVPGDGVDQDCDGEDGSSDTGSPDVHDTDDHHHEDSGGCACTTTGTPLFPASLLGLVLCTAIVRRRRLA